MKKVMFICSAGRHLTENLKIEKLFEKYDYVLVTEKNKNYEITFNTNGIYNNVKIELCKLYVDNLIPKTEVIKIQN